MSIEQFAPRSEMCSVQLCRRPGLQGQGPDPGCWHWPVSMLRCQEMHCSLLPAPCSPRAECQVPGICAALAGHWPGHTGGGDLNAGPRGNTETGAARPQSVEQWHVRRTSSVIRVMTPDRVKWPGDKIRQGRSHESPEGQTLRLCDPWEMSNRKTMVLLDKYFLCRNSWLGWVLKHWSWAVNTELHKEQH